MLKHKDDASDELIRMNMEHKNMVGRYVATWHLDGGREFNRFRKWANHAERGIQIKISPPRTPEANGLAEQYGGLLNRISRVMILDAGLPAHLWPYATSYAYSDVVPTNTSRRKIESHPRKWDLVQKSDTSSVSMGTTDTFTTYRTYKDNKKDPGGVPTREPDPKGPIPAGPGAVLKLDNAFLHQTTNISDNTRALIEQPDPEEDVIRGRIHTISVSAEPPPTRSIENATEYEASSTKYAAQDYRLPDPTEPEE
ncbi:hypothetical protein CBS11852_2563 [Aspergillus niger]|nr:hypothetical protein CBS11852_2563 [Aspergillus niger]